jgi:hypothetical protein
MIALSKLFTGNHSTKLMAQTKVHEWKSQLVHDGCGTIIFAETA